MEESYQFFAELACDSNVPSMSPPSLSAQYKTSLSHSFIPYPYAQTFGHHHSHNIPHTTTESERIETKQPLLTLPHSQSFTDYSEELNSTSTTTLKKNTKIKDSLRRTAFDSGIYDQPMLITAAPSTVPLHYSTNNNNNHNLIHRKKEDVTSSSSTITTNTKITSPSPTIISLTSTPHNFYSPQPTSTTTTSSNKIQSSTSSNKHLQSVFKTPQSSNSSRLFNSLWKNK